MNQKRGTVLIVDDEESVRHVLQQFVERAGYWVTTAAGGVEALQQITQREFDVMLLDVGMPQVSGVEVLHQLRLNHPDTTVIMVTAVDDAQTVIDTMKMGAFDYIIKPYVSEDLILKVERAHDRRILALQNRRYQRHLQDTVEEQRVRLQKQFAELIQSLAREHAIHYELESVRSRKSRYSQPLESLPPEFRKPMGSVQEYAAALLRLIQEGRTPRVVAEEKEP